MTFFLIGYACGLKEKIKTVMRTLLAGISVFVLYTSSAHAQLVYLEDTSMPPVPRYLEKFLMMQTQGWASSPAYSAGNKAFFSGLKTQIEDLPVEDHVRTLTYIIDQLSAMSPEKVKEVYNVDKHIVVALLSGIRDIAEKEGPVTENSTSNDTDSPDKSTSSMHSNEYYDIEIKEYQGTTYYIYHLADAGSIKQADFHGKNGGFHHCLYQQCDTVVFPEDMRPQEVHMSFAHANKEPVIINLNETSHQITTKKTSDTPSSEIVDTKNDTSPSEQKTSTEAAVSEEDLLQELNDIFGDIL